MLCRGEAVVKTPNRLKLVDMDIGKRQSLPVAGFA